MDTGEQEPGPRSIALPLAMAAVAILLLGWALVASQDAAEAQEITENTPAAHPPSPSGGGGASGRHPLQPLQPHTRPPGTG